MNSFVKSWEYWETIEDGFKEPNQATIEDITNAQRAQLNEQRKREVRALWKIQQCTDDTIFPSTMNVKTTKEA